MGLISPTVPTAGADRGTEEVDVINAIIALLNLVNGSFDTANIAVAAGILASQLEANARPVTAGAPYRPILGPIGMPIGNAHGTGLWYVKEGDSNANGSNAASGLNGLVIPATNPFLLSGLTPKLRLLMHLGTNAVNPGATIITGSLRPVTFGGTGGALTVTLGAAVTSVAVSGPAPGVVASDVSADFNVPAAGFYMLGFQASAAVASNSVINALLELDLHHV